MLQSVVYKEWIKTRWFLLILLVLGLLVIGNMYLKVQHAITFNGANKYWYLVLFQNQIYYKGLKFIPIAIGLAVAIAQYIPEIMNKRIKLTFHLPVNENKVLLLMLSYGIVVLLASYLILFIVFTILSNSKLPPEVVHTAISSITPWFLAGFAAYFLGAMVILEAIWKYRIAYFIASCAFILFYFEKSIAGGYALMNWKLVILTVIISTSLLFSAYRFRKGEM